MAKEQIVDIVARLKVETDSAIQQIQTVGKTLQNSLNQNTTSKGLTEKLARDFRDLGKDVEAFRSKLDNGLNNASDGKKLEQTAIRLNSRFASLQERINSIVLNPEKFIPEEAANRIKKLTQAYENAVASVNEFQVAERRAAVEGEIENKKKQVDELTQKWIELSDAKKQAEQEETDNKKAFDNYTKKANEAKNKIEQLRQKQAELEKTKSAKLPFYDEYQKKVAQATADIKALEAEQEKLKAAGDKEGARAIGVQIADKRAEKEQLTADAIAGGYGTKQMKELDDSLRNINGQIRTTDREFKNFNANANKADKAAGAAGIKVAELGQKMAGLKTQTDASEQELRDLEIALQNIKATSSADAVEQLKQKFLQLGVSAEQLSQIKDFEGFKRLLEQLRGGEIERSGKTLAKVSAVAEELAKKFNITAAEAEKAKSSLLGFEQTERELNSLKSRLTYFLGAQNAINILRRTIRKAYESVKELDKAMTETAVVTDFSVGDLWEQLPRYTKVANDLGATTLGAYQTMTLFYQQGLETNEAFEVGTETMKMARIAGLEYADATNLMTAALRGFNMELNETSAQRVNDVYSELAAITAADTNEIATAMTKTASIAASANMEFETTAALLAQIIETTRESPETAGTAMKTIIARFTEVKSLFSKGMLSGEDAEGEAIDINKIDTALKTVGISLKDFLNGSKGLDDIFLELAEKWDDLDLATQRYIATTAAGSRQQSRFIAMMSDYSRTTELVGAATNSAGASQRQFEKTMESLEAKTNRLSNAYQQFTMKLADNEAIKTVIDLLNMLLTFVNNLTNLFGLTDQWGAIGSSISSILTVGIVGGIYAGLRAGMKVADTKIVEWLSKKKAQVITEAQKTGVASGQSYTNGVNVSKNTSNNMSRPGRGISIAAGIAGTMLGGAIAEQVIAGDSKLGATEDSLNGAAEAANTIKNELEDVNNELKNLSKKRKDIENLTKEINSMARGSAEYSQKLLELSSEMDAIFRKFPELLADKDLVEMVGGISTLTGKGWAEYYNLLNNQQYELQQQQRALNTQQQILENRTQANSSGLETTDITAKEAGKIQTWQKAGSLLGGVAATTLAVAFGPGGAIAGALVAALSGGLGSFLGGLLFGKGSKSFYDIGYDPDFLVEIARIAGEQGFNAQTDNVDAFLNSSAVQILMHQFGLTAIQAQELEQWIKKDSEAFNKHVQAVLGNDAAIEETARQWASSAVDKMISNFRIDSKDAPLYEGIYSKYYEDNFKNYSEEIGKELSKKVGTSTKEFKYREGAEELYRTFADISGYNFNTFNSKNPFYDENGKIVEGITDEFIRQTLISHETQERILEELQDTNQTVFDLSTSIGKLGAALEAGKKGFLDFPEIAKYWQDAHPGLTTSGEIFSALKDYERQAATLVSDYFREAQGHFALDPNGVFQKYHNQYTDLINQLIEDGALSLTATKITQVRGGFFPSTQSFDNVKDYLAARRQEGRTYGGNGNPIYSYSDFGYTYDGSEGHEIIINFLADKDGSEGILEFIEQRDSYASSLGFKKVEGQSAGEAMDAAIDKLLLDMDGRFKDSIATNLEARYSLGALAGAYKGNGDTMEPILGYIEEIYFKDPQGFAQIAQAAEYFTDPLEVLKAAEMAAADESFELAESLLNMSKEMARSEHKTSLTAEAFKTYVDSFTEIINKIKEAEDGKRVSFTEKELDTILTKLGPYGITEDDFILTTDGYVYTGELDTIIELLQDLGAHLGDLTTKGASKEDEQKYEQFFGENGPLKAKDIGFLDQTIISEDLYNYLIEEGMSDLAFTPPVWITDAETGVKRIGGYKLTNEKAAGEAEQILQSLITRVNSEEDPRDSATKLLSTHGGQGILNANAEDLGLKDGDKTALLDLAIEEQQLGEEVADVTESLVAQDVSWREHNNLIKAAIIDGNNAEKIYGELADIINENAEILSDANKESEAYRETLYKVVDSAQKAFGDYITKDFVEKNLELFKAWASGAEGAADQIREKLKKSAFSDYSIEQAEGLRIALEEIEKMDLEIGGHADFTEIFSQLTKLMGSSAEAAKAIERLGYTVTFEVDKGHMIQLPDLLGGGEITLPKVRAVITNTFDEASGGSNFSSGAGRGGGGSSKEWENPYDELYNITQKINAELRERNKLEREYEAILRNRGTTAQEIYENSREQLDSLAREKDLQEQLLAGRKRQISEFTAENKEMSKYGNIITDEKGHMRVEIDWALIDSIKNEKEGSAIEDYVSRLEELVELAQEAEDALYDIEDSVVELQNQGKDEYFELEDLVMDALVKSYQDRIDEAQLISDSIYDANSKLVDAMAESIEQSRQERENAETEEELANKQRRLAYLQQDTSGANALEILRLQKELEEEQEDYTDTLIDQKISALQKQNEEANEQRQRQIEIAQSQLEWVQENGELWKEVNSIIKNGLGENKQLLTNSKLAELLKDQALFKGMSELGKMKWLEETENLIATGIAWLMNGNLLGRLMQSGEVTKGQEITFTTGDGKTVTGTVGAYGEVAADGWTYTGVYAIGKDENGRYQFATSETYKEPPKQTPSKPSKEDRGDTSGWTFNGETYYSRDGAKEAIEDWRIAEEGYLMDEYDTTSDWDKTTVEWQEDWKDRWKKVQTNYRTYIEQLNKYKFKTGGLADFTGPAWLDGTKSKPEIVLNQRDTQNFLALRDILSNFMSTRPDKSSGKSGDNYFEIDIHVDKIDSSYDVEQLASDIKDLIRRDASARNVNLIGLRG